MPVSNKVRNSYEQLLEAIEAAAVNSNTGYVYFRRAAVFQERESDILFDCYLYLKKWKWRPGDTSEQVDIVVHANESLSKDGAQITRSAVEVSYFDVTGKNAKLMHSTHFDFVGAQDNHPIFHAQQTGKAVLPPDNQRLELQCELKWDEVKTPCFKNARIPTPDMTLSSVLLCLAADHVAAEYFREFRQRLVEIQREMPLPACAELRTSLEAGCPHVRSVHWFAHMV